VALRADQLDGRTLSLVEELHWLLGVDRLPRRGPPFHELHARLEQLLPGREPLSRRLEAYQRRFIVARGRLNGVVMRALAACRAKTVRHLELPPGESVGVEYVADRPWSGYSVYHGDFRSTIQINRVFSFSVDQILTLACHEGYPGHHVYNVLRDRDIVRGRRWPEASVLPVFSPAGFRAETLATAAGALAFSPAERIALFRRELFPAAGLTPAQAERYVHVGSIVDALAGEIAAVIVTYLQGTIGRDEAARSLRERALMEHPEPLLAFVDRYRAYALAYTIGREWLQPDPDGSTEIWSNLTRLIVPEQGTPR
jgi:hypothetical protein